MCIAMSPISWLLFSILLVPMSTFPPQTVPSEPHTRSHREITIEGVFRGVSHVLQSSLLVNATHADPTRVVKNYFGSDTGGFENFYNVLLRIVDSENKAQRYSQKESYMSVNGEQIYRAHMYLCNLRMRLQKISQTLPIDKDFLLESVGRYLYTLQEFYSNTNWVELHGITINENLGVVSDLGYQVADLSEDTCDNCEKRTCFSNDYRNGRLTSGYRSGQDVQKPAKPSDFQSGKCSHGGQGDASSSIPARGGINKERYNVTFSPHYYLHPQASEAAVKATDFFISANKTGLVHILGLKVFLEVFQLQRKDTQKGYSIAFAIDTTGSMSDDINAVIQNSINIVTSLQGSANAPEKYIITTFSDPVRVPVQYSTPDGYELIQRLKRLRAHGGGDCPEYALAGTLAAINMSLPGSTVYVFTDADAKDRSQASSVVQEAKKRDVTIQFLLTGTCSSKRRRRDNSLDIFNEIAQSTGGSVYQTSKENISQVMATVMKETMPSADVINDIAALGGGEDNLTILIDSQTTVVKITISGAHEDIRSQVQLLNPNDTQVVFQGNFSFIYMSTADLNIIALKSPEPGMWSLSIVGLRKNVTVNVTAQSPLYFTTNLMEGSGGMLSSVEGNPILGQHYVFLTTVYNLENGSVDRLGVYNGGGIQYLNLTPMRNDHSTIHSIYMSDIKLTAGISGVVLEGRGNGGYRFKRTRLVEIEPVMIELSMLQITGEQRTLEPFNVSYTVTNRGNQSVSLTGRLVITQGESVHRNIPEQALNLPPHNKISSNFEITSKSDILKYRIEILKQGKELQRQENTVLITDKIHPEFEHLNKSSDCPAESMNTGNCSQYPWTAEARLTFAGVNITNITLSSAAQLRYVINSSAISVAIQGTCCIPSTQLQIYDSEFYSVSKSVDLSGGRVVRSVSNPSRNNAQKITIVPALIGGVIGGLVFVCLLVAAVVYIRKKVSDTSYSTSR